MKVSRKFDDYDTSRTKYIYFVLSYSVDNITVSPLSPLEHARKPEETAKQDTQAS